MKKTSLLLLLLFSQIYCFTQEKKFIIIDENNKQSIAYCSVSIIGKDKGEYSDSKGIVRINCSENDSLLISHILYSEIKIQFKKPNQINSSLNSSIFLKIFGPQRIHTLIQVHLTFL